MILADWLFSPFMFMLLWLVFSLLAVFVPVMGLVKFRRLGRCNWPTYAVISLASCAASLYFQLQGFRYEIARSDFSALADWHEGFGMVTVLFIAALVLNLILGLLARRRHAVSADQQRGQAIVLGN